MGEGHRQRLREKFLEKGIRALTQVEVLEILLTYCIPRKDTSEMAKTLLRRFGSIKNVLQADVDQLMDVPGFGPNTANMLFFLTQFMTKYDVDKEIARYLRTSQEMGYYLIAKYGRAKHENLIALYFDRDHRLILDLVIQAGELKYVPLDVPRIKKEYSRTKAAYMVLAHNHPSGIALPSTMDIINTAHLRQDLKRNNMVLHDHIIFESADFISLLDSNMFKELDEI